MSRRMDGLMNELMGLMNGLDGWMDTGVDDD